MHQSEVPIPSPCAADWNAMSGDARKRFCSTCDKHVHDLSAMTEREARATAIPGSCVRYAHDRLGRIRHLPAFAIGTLLAGPALASGIPADDVAPPEGIVNRVARAVSGWWKGEPVVIEPLVQIAGGIAPPPPAAHVTLAPSVPLPVVLEIACAEGPRTRTLDTAESWIDLPYDGACTARFAGDPTPFALVPYTSVHCEAAHGERCVVQ